MAAEYDPELDLNMTPMIDVVFLLLIFFMLVTKMTQDELEELVLPAAEQAEEDNSDDDDRFFINLVKSDPEKADTSYLIIINSTDVTPKKAGGKWLINGSQLEKILIDEAQLAGGEFSERQVLIRADQDCPYEYVAMVMAALVRPSIKIYKVQLAAKKVNEGMGVK